MKHRFLLAAVSLVAAVGLVSCGGGGGGSSAPPAKGLFSLWKETSTNVPLDLTGGSFSNKMPILSLFANGAQCQCQLILIGDQSSGTWSFGQCVYVTGTGTGDPGCASFTDAGTYTKSSDTLTTCSGSPQTCDTWK